MRVCDVTIGGSFAFDFVVFSQDCFHLISTSMPIMLQNNKDNEWYKYVYTYVWKRGAVCFCVKSAVGRGEIFKRHHIRIRFPEANYDQTQPFEMVRGYDRLKKRAF